MLTAIEMDRDWVGTGNKARYEYGAKAFYSLSLRRQLVSRGESNRAGEFWRPGPSEVMRIGC